MSIISEFEITYVAHDWVRIKVGNKNYEFSTHNDAIFGDAEKHREEVESIKNKSLAELKEEYRLDGQNGEDWTEPYSPTTGAR